MKENIIKEIIDTIEKEKLDESLDESFEATNEGLDLAIYIIKCYAKEKGIIKEENK